MNKNGDQQGSVPKDWMGALTSCFFYCTALVLAICGMKVAFWKADGAAAKDALLLLASAVGVIFVREAMLLLPRVRRLKVLDKIEFELPALQQRTASAEEKAESAARKAETAQVKADVAWDSTKQFVEEQGGFGGSAISERGD